MLTIIHQQYEWLDRVRESYDDSEIETFEDFEYDEYLNQQFLKRKIEDQNYDFYEYGYLDAND